MGYTITDHLGSIWALAYEDGTFIEKYAYDPWGRRVNPDDWSLVDNRNQFITDRGFTLHEHYDQMQIINMVARLYDPILGQFISVDPLADKYPGWGAYVYCMNNPLEYWDPTGEEVFLSGDESDEFLAALNEYFENIEIEMDDEGKLSFSGEAVTDDELMMVEALNDENVKCNINTTSLPVTETKDLFCGGAAMGTELSEDKKSVVARQTVNPSVLNKVDDVKNTHGGSSVHEVTECYQAGLWSMKKERDLNEREYSS